MGTGVGLTSGPVTMETPAPARHRRRPGGRTRPAPVTVAGVVVGLLLCRVRHLAHRIGDDDPHRRQHRATTASTTTPHRADRGRGGRGLPGGGLHHQLGRLAREPGLEAHRPAGPDPDGAGGQGGVLLRRVHTVLGPTGWSCSRRPWGTRAPPAWSSTPPGAPNPAAGGSPPAGTEGSSPPSTPPVHARGRPGLPVLHRSLWQQNEAHCTGSSRPASRAPCPRPTWPRSPTRPAWPGASRDRRAPNRSPAR